MTKATDKNIPPEAAQIMKRMVSMPPKPHDDMKLGKSKPKAGSDSKGVPPQSKKRTPKKRG
ncbi:MAG: hypothetical protein ACLPID_06225 [Beijerinckiaceae bacterium]